jgi:tetratricopeptide (TPR) repeat protein
MADVSTQGSRAHSRWLYGPAPDLLFGCGGAYAFVFAALLFAGGTLQTLVPLGLLPLAILVTSIPHYGATLLRVYERAEDRRKYRVFALWSTLFVYAWLVGGVYDVALGSWLVTLYLTWSPWHYSGQNYGIALLFLGRRGLAPDATTKRWLYASFALSYAIAFLGTHAASQSVTYAPASLEGVTYRLMRVGIPQSVFIPGVLAVASAYLLAIGVVVTRLRRSGAWRDLAPALCLVALQALWFSIPVIFRMSGAFAERVPFDPSAGEYAFLWIAMGHAVQYLWVTRYYASAARPESAGPYYGKTLLAGGAIWGVPLLLFGPDLLGVRAFDAGLGLLVAAAVNVHHFVLDGAIWKLRDGRIARVLLRARDPDVRAGGFGDRAAISLSVRGAIALAGVVYALTTVLGTLEFEFGVRRATEPLDPARLETAAQRLRWLGRDHPDVHYNLGVHALREGDLARARSELQRSLALRENSLSWLALGLVERRDGRPDASLAAYDAALDIDPRSVPALVQSARSLEELGDTRRARERLERALALEPDRSDLRDALSRP